MATLRRAFRLGREKRRLRSDLTFPQFADTNRGRYIPPGDFYAILGHITVETKRDFCELAYLNGIRKGQLRATELSNVDPERWVLTWRPEQVKTREAHVLPLVGRSQEIVQRLWTSRRLDCRHLFHHRGKQMGDLRREWESACRKAGFPVGRKHGGYVFHNTRHSAVTNLNAAGVPDSVAMSISGHRTAAVFRRYSIRQESVQKAAMERVAAYLADVATKPAVTPIARAQGD